MNDIHCHILYGVDDGAESLQESLQMLDCAKSAGIECIYATPHIKSKDIDVLPIYERFAILHKYAQEKQIDLRLGFEYNIKAIDYDNMAQARDYAMAGTDCLLLEMPFSDWPPLWENIIYDLQALKLQIIIAHPERYLPIQKNYAIIDSLCDMGCFFQCNVSSIVNGGIRKAGVIRYLRKTGRLDFVATDAHSVYEYRLIQRAIAKVRKEINYQTFDEILEK